MDVFIIWLWIASGILAVFLLISFFLKDEDMGWTRWDHYQVSKRQAKPIGYKDGIPIFLKKDLEEAEKRIEEYWMGKE